MLYPEATGPFSAMRRFAAQAAGDESAKRFMCYHCIRVRRYTMGLIFAALAILIAAVLVLGALHVI